MVGARLHSYIQGSIFISTCKFYHPNSHAPDLTISMLRWKYSNQISQNILQDLNTYPLAQQATPLAT
jgi:hypothetical protein